jgi:hypothetical protein
MIKRDYILILLLIIIVNTVRAQSEIIYNAYDYWDNGNGDFLKAAELLDQAIETDDSLFVDTWQLRAIVYWEIYKVNDNRSVLSDARVFSLISILKSLEIDTEKVYFNQSIEILDRIAVSYYNDAVYATMNLNANDPKFAENSYFEYKRIKKISHPGINLDKSDIDFYNALSTALARVYDEDREQNKDLFTLNIEALNNVLAIDSNNYGANYNMAIYYYNEGALRIQTIDSQVDFMLLSIIQEYSVKMFKNSLPYMLKANEIKHRRESVKGLRGIYNALYDYEKVDYYSRELKKFDEENPDE